MSDFLPAGRLSSVIADGVVVQIQTEFACRPRPRVATTVCLEGVVINKIQKDWEGPVESAAQQHSVERFINRQHDEVVTIIESQKHKLVNGHRGKTVNEKLKKISTVWGVLGAWLLSEEGIMTTDASGGPKLEEYAPLFEGLVSLCSLLSSVSALGKSLDGDIILDEDRLLILRQGNSYFIAAIDPAANPVELLATLRTTLEAA